jgi:hypothetical protein
MRHGPDNRLSALIYRDVLHPDGLLTSASISLERLDLCREGAGELVEGALRVIEPSAEGLLRMCRRLQCANLMRLQVAFASK